MRRNKMPESGFRDISVTGIAKDKTQKLDQYTYEVCFVLSDSPPKEWANLFEAHSNWTSVLIRPKYHWARVKIEGYYAVMQIADMNSLQEHCDELKDAISYTNRTYKEDLLFQHIKDPQARHLAKEKWRADQEKPSWEQKLDDLDFS
jgi:hypothetical protein